VRYEQHLANGKNNEPPPLDTTDEESLIVGQLANWLQARLPHLLAKTRESYAKSMFEYGFKSVESLDKK